MRYRFDDNMRRQHKIRNFLHSILLLGGMGVVLALCAFGLFGFIGMIVVLMVGFLVAFWAPKVAPEWVIRAHKGQSLDKHNFPKGIAMINALAKRAGLKNVPKLYYIPSRMLNAFATGSRDRAAIAITDGLLRSMNEREMAGILAHEISHIDNNDIWLMGLADLLGRMTSTMSYIGLFTLLFSLGSLFTGNNIVPLWVSALLIIAPTICSLLQLALSRAREFDADLEAVTLTGDPGGLASALAKLERKQGRHWEDIMLPGRRMPDPSLLRTHPPTADRIARLGSLIVPEATPNYVNSLANLFSNCDFAEPSPPRFIWPGFWR